jgi:OOP family OmpA-OmpF porin
MSKPLIWILGAAAWLLLATICVHVHGDINDGEETQVGATDGQPELKPLVLGKTNGQWQLTGSVPSEVAKTSLLQQSKLHLGEEPITESLQINAKAPPVPNDFPPDLRGLRDPLALWDGKKMSLQGWASSEKTLSKIRTGIPEALKTNLHDGLGLDEQAQGRVQSQIKQLLETPLEFEAASHRLTAPSQARLDGIASQIELVPDAIITISGHTDNVGQENTNVTLSQARADSVKDYLISKGLQRDRFLIKAFGSSQPISDNKTENGRARNRRIEFTLQ